jgi:FSR family fosmidomycin resistance protein-like MFS transporter
VLVAARGGAKRGAEGLVTLGLGVSVGGLTAPLFGLIAEAHGPQGVLTALCCVPIPALLFGLLLKIPRRDG